MQPYSVAWRAFGYIWSHRYKVTISHMSEIYTIQKEDHQVGETRQNTMKGKEFNKL